MAEQAEQTGRRHLTLVPVVPPPLNDAAGSIGQAEMPFAIVEGEPLTRLPRDLYIPPHALEVFLEAFEGPLDLLLYLIRHQNIDILDIPIAEISRQYVEYIELMKEMQFELAGEYLVMAATLAEIKSRLLLPRPAGVDEEEEDPRAALVRRLREYERYRKAAEGIDGLERLERDIAVAQAEVTGRKVVTKLPDVTLGALLAAFREALARSSLFEHHRIQQEPLSVRERMSQVLLRLSGKRYMYFNELLDPAEGRAGIAVTFLALLELLKEAVIDVVQTEEFGPIHVRAAQAAAGEALAPDTSGHDNG